MTVSEQVKTLKKHIAYLEKMSVTWIKEGKVSEQQANYDIECLKYAINTLIEVDKFKNNIIALNEVNLK